MHEAFETVSAGYDRIAERYRDASSPNPVRLAWLGLLLAELAPDSVVVDLGCGPGDPATKAFAERHRVIGVDGSAVQLRIAQQAAPSALLVQADMTRFAVRLGSVDAVASFYALGHLPADRHVPLLSAIAGWLRPGGWLLTSAPLAAGNGTDPDWMGVPMFFGGIGEAATRQGLDDCGLAVERWEVVEEDEGDEGKVAFLWLIARRPVDRTMGKC